MSPSSSPDASTPLARATTITACAALAGALLECALYLRTGPYATPYVLNFRPYLAPAVAYAACGLLWASLPFLAGAALAQRRGSRFVRGQRLQIAALATLLALTQLDHELARFLGVRLSLDVMRTYAAVHKTPGAIWETLAADSGGAWSSLWLLLVPVAFVPASLLAARRVQRTPPRWVFAALLLLGVVLPITRLTRKAGAQGRDKVAPLLVYALRAASERDSLRDTPLPAGARDAYRAYWSAHDAGHWQFDDDTYPLRRHYVGSAPLPSKRPNFVLIVLETFRALDMARFNPHHQGPNPTPYLDGLAAHAQSAYYPHFYANAVPTVYAFMALHTSSYGHSQYAVAKRFGDVQFDALPQRLRAQGYHTAHFTGTDPDWDSQRLWLTRWYDEAYYSPEDHGQDRPVFRKARERIRTLGRAGQPFLATIVSISNHTPFQNPEPALAIVQGDAPAQRIRNTMRYTDDVVRELIEGLRDERFFEDTIFLITGDHAFDLGERGAVLGMTNLHHETTWVPLIVHGADARLPRGRVERIASHVDIAPTLLELAGDYGPVSHVGHSLLEESPAGGSALSTGRGKAALEEALFGVVFAPQQKQPRVYAHADALQRSPLRSHPAMLASQAAAHIFHACEGLMEWTLENDRVAPRPVAHTR